MTHHLTSSWTRHIRARRALLSTRDANTSPGPVRAASAATKDVNLRSTTRHATCNTADGEAGNGHSSRGLAGGASVLIVLLDDDAVLCDVGQLDVLVCHALDRARCPGDGLDANAVIRIGDGGGLDDDVGNVVVVPPSYRANA